MPKHSYHSIYTSLIAISAAFAGILLGYDGGIIGVSKDQVTDLFLISDNQWALTAGASIFGAIIGLALCGLLSNLTGRKNMLMLVALGFLSGILCTATSHNLNQFIIGRFITGVSIGMGSFTTPLFISEIAPAHLRGTLLMINGIAITLGQSLSFLIGYSIYNLNSESWRYQILFEIIPALFLLIAMIIVPHSPRWVAMKYGIDRAKTILNKLRGESLVVENEIREIQNVLANEKLNISFCKLFSNPLKRVTALGLILGMGQQLMGIGALLYYGPVIFSQSGFTTTSSSILATFGIGLVNLVCTIGVMFLVDHFGRRPLLLFGSFLAGFSLFMGGFFNYYGMLSPIISFLCLSFYIIGYCISLGSLFWVIIAEIYPLKARGMAMSLAAIAETTASLVVTLSFLPLMQWVGMAGVYWIYCGLCLLSFVFILIYVPETKAVSLEQIENNVIRGVKLRNLGKE